MIAVPDRSVALVVTSPPYFVGKEYEQAITGTGEVTRPHIPDSYIEYLQMLRDVFAECKRTLEPGGRIAVNVANLGRKPYRSLSADVMRILQDDLGLLLRGEIIWQKAEGASGSVAWGSFNKATNPVLRDVTERVIVASKGRFDRARSRQQREKDGYPFENTMPVDEFMEATLDVWRIDAESARRVQHPAPFPVELPRRLIELYTFEDDLILDPFLGSGTTLVAAVRTGRRGVGYDLDSAYVETANSRYQSESERYFRHRQSDTVHQERLALELPPEEFTPEERADHFQRRASREGKKAQDLARGVLERVGFKVIDEAYKLPRSGVQFNLRVVDAQGDREFLVDVSGAFTTARPGLLRTDTLWKTLGRAHVLKSLDEDARLLVVTSNLPRPGSDGEKALHAVGPGNVWDAIEMFDAGGVDRLAAYAQGHAEQLPGFWTEEELAARRDEQLARYYDADDE
jgi:site-specific DNA-methyltransferase (adenine-specific)